MASFVCVAELLYDSNYDTTNGSHDVGDSAQHTGSTHYHHHHHHYHRHHYYLHHYHYHHDDHPFIDQ